MCENTIFLQNQDIWLEMMQFNIITGEKKIIPHINGQEIRGHYGKVNNCTVMFYKIDNVIYLDFKNKVIPMCAIDVKLIFERIGKNNKFILIKGNDILITEVYPSCAYDSVNRADFDFNDDKEEDQDFFLFVYNVMENIERQKLIYTL